MAPNGGIQTDVLLDSGAQINSVSADTREDMQVLGTTRGKHVEVCSPLKGTCTQCMIGKGTLCLSCNDNTELFEEEFFVLPESNDKPILGIRTMREMDLVGKYPLLFKNG